MLITTKTTHIASAKITTVTHKPLNMYDAMGGLQELRQKALPSIILDTNQELFYIFDKRSERGWHTCTQAEIAEFGKDGVVQGVTLILKVDEDKEVISDQTLANILMDPDTYKDPMCNIKALTDGIKSLIKDDEGEV